MKKNLFMMMAVSAAVIFASCSKDDEGGSEGQFSIQVPSFVKGTTPIRVDLSVACDAAPTVTFATEGSALGVVSLSETPNFDSEYVYAGEPIDVRFANGTASASFWYFPLTIGDHGVSFSVAFTQNGIAKTTTSRRVLSVSDAANGGFYPEVVIGEGQGYYIFGIQNKLDKKGQGCDFYVALESLEGETEQVTSVTIWTSNHTEVMENNIFYPVQYDSQGYGSLSVWGEGTTHISAAVTLKLICRDDYNRCRDVVVTTDAQGNVVSSEASEYYLWRNRK